MSIAFFDIDGTLLPHPSLERRLFWKLLREGKIPASNWFLWVAEMFRLRPAGFREALHSNKTYLHDVPCRELCEKPSSRALQWLPKFYPEAIQRLWWHALHGDSIVLVTGTLAPLARIVKGVIERELLWRGVEIEVQVMATELCVRDGRWTGSVSGRPMFGRAKSMAMKEFAKGQGTPLSLCYAYGDHGLDHAMLEAVGSAFAVNPSSALLRIARQKRWPVLRWRIRPHPINIVWSALKWRREAAR